MGDIGEVDYSLIASSNGYFKPGDYVGKGGIEKTYEKGVRRYTGKEIHIC